MKKCRRKFYYWLSAFGINPFLHKPFKAVKLFLKDRKELKKQLEGTTDFPFGMTYPILTDRFDTSGTMSGAYFHQDLHVARRIYEANPGRHIDIGSRTDGFVSHVAVFREIEIFDIRKQESKMENIIFTQADLMNLPPELTGVCESVSSLHAIEHFGLGRYSDPVDANGHIKAIENIYNMLKPDGVFYFSVPIGPQRIEFNAHRVFSIAYLLKMLENKFRIAYFSYVDDQGDFFKHIALTEELIDSNCNCNYGCGIFELIKIE